MYLSSAHRIQSQGTMVSLSTGLLLKGQPRRPSGRGPPQNARGTVHNQLFTLLLAPAGPHPSESGQTTEQERYFNLKML